MANGLTAAEIKGKCRDYLRKAFDSEAAEVVEESWKMKSAPGSGNSGGAQS